MREISFNTQGSSTYLVIKLAPGEQPARMDLGMMMNNQIPGLLPVSRRQMNADAYLFYGVQSLTPLSMANAFLANDRRLVTFLRSFCQLVKECEEYLLDARRLLLDPNYVFVQAATGTIHVAYLPFAGETGPVSHYEFVKAVLSMVGGSMDSPVLQPLYRIILLENQFTVGALDEVLTKMVTEGAFRQDQGKKQSAAPANNDPNDGQSRPNGGQQPPVGGGFPAGGQPPVGGGYPGGGVQPPVSQSEPPKKGGLGALLGGKEKTPKPGKESKPEGGKKGGGLFGGKAKADNVPPAGPMGFPGGDVTPPAGPGFPGGNVTPPAGPGFPGGNVTPPAGPGFPGGNVTPPAGPGFPGSNVTPPAGPGFPGGEAKPPKKGGLFVGGKPESGKKVGLFGGKAKGEAGAPPAGPMGFPGGSVTPPAGPGFPGGNVAPPAGPGFPGGNVTPPAGPGGYGGQPANPWQGGYQQPPVQQGYQQPPVQQGYQQPAVQQPGDGYTYKLDGSDLDTGVSGMTDIMVPGAGGVGPKGPSSLWLVRRSTGQRVQVTHSNFHIGRGDGLVDFNVTTNTTYMGTDHAYLLQENGRWMVVDNNSKNHTWLNNQMLNGSQPYPIQGGDVLVLADETFDVKDR